MGAGAVCCPPAIEPPTPQHSRCRNILRILAAFLIPIAVLSLVVGSAYQIFICLLLAFFLFMGWRLFNWCTVLIFFIYALQQILTSTIIIIGYIEYNQFFRTKHITYSVYLVVEEIYFIFAILVSHYVYRVFKSHQNGGGMIFGNNPPAEAPQGQAPYQHLQEENEAPAAPAPRRNKRINQSSTSTAFQGQGVRIG